MTSSDSDNNQITIDTVDDPRFGIRIYRSVLPEYITDISVIENAMSIGANPDIKWSPALVGDYQEMLDYRDCMDCKLRPNAVQGAGVEYESFKALYNDLTVFTKACVDNYSAFYGISMSYMEAVNFVRYSTGQHFQVHADHGFSYTCTISTVAYLNDDFEGGELWFPYIDQKYTPRRGDIVICPSNFIYSHASLPVKSGIKYSAVTMFDYNDRFHKYSPGYNEDGTLVKGP
jgi:Rps23 Pro-64 3,4-dihydroxylase Tpa1-like proline 4-hydroxylase